MLGSFLLWLFGICTQDMQVACNKGCLVPMIQCFDRTLFVYIGKTHAWYKGRDSGIGGFLVDIEDMRFSVRFAHILMQLDATR